MHIFLKFGEKQHLEMLQSEGLLYCKSVLEFAKLEDDAARGDKFENVIKLKLLEESEVLLKPKNDGNSNWKSLDINYGQVRISNNNYDGNLFCMSYFPINESVHESEISISSRFLKEFGTHYLLILDQPEFFRRIDNALTEKGIEYERRCVDYLDLKKFTGTKTIFQKDNEFRWQSEYRIYMRTGKKILQTYNIGSIQDISHLGELNDSISFVIKRSQ